MTWDRSRIAQEIARRVERGWTINLGVGIPTAVAQYTDFDSVMIQSENGIWGVGRQATEEHVDSDLVDAGKNFTMTRPGTSFFDSLTSFAMIRGGRIDLTVMGAYQVGANGDLANWKVPGREFSGIGGAADLAAGARRVWIAMTHTDKDGAGKLMHRCSFPLTAAGVVDLIFTDYGIFRPSGDRFDIVELADDIELEELPGFAGDLYRVTAPQR
jgi:3-oxoacid CoA-transferase subunit B